MNPRWTGLSQIVARCYSFMSEPPGAVWWKLRMLGVTYRLLAVCVWTFLWCILIESKLPLMKSFQWKVSSVEFCWYLVWVQVWIVLCCAGVCQMFWSEWKVVNSSIWLVLVLCLCASSYLHLLQPTLPLKHINTYPSLRCSELQCLGL